VSVAVVEIAGGVAFLKPGAAAGVRRNARVKIEGREYVVTSATATYAVIEGTPLPKEQATGTASTISEEDERPKELPPPRPAAQLAGLFPEWRAPAETQHPKPVPLGLPDRSRRYEVLLYGYAGGVTTLGDRGGGFVRGEIGARVHVEPFSAPIAFDFDGSVQRWFGAGVYDRDGTRPTARIRELQLGIGNPAAYFAGLGRIRYAASTLGALDGLRARAPLGGGFSASAFGGVVPDPLLGAVSFDAQRFGAEVALSRPEIALRPEAALVVQGSTYDGRLDERRLTALAAIYPGQSRAGAHMEVSAFDKDNPWRVNPIELTAAGVDGRVRAGIFHFGARADMRQPERSRHLAAYLPPSWFCGRVAGPPAAAGAPPNPDACDPRVSTYYQLGVDAGMTTEHVALFLAGTGSTNLLRPSAPSQAGLMLSARVLRIYQGLRVEGSATASTGTFMDAFSGAIGPGITTLGDRLDASLYYRRSVLQYRVGDVLGGNAFGGYATLLVGTDLVLSLQGEGIDGDDLRALMGALVMVWRPRL
jgi:hypothetical protein